MAEVMSEQPPEPQKLGVLAVVNAYVDLIKPRIIGLLLVTTYATMLIAAGEEPSFSLIFYTLLGGTLSAGSANAINMVYDRDIDAIMKRTRWRPLPSGRISPRNALIFAITLGLIAVAELAYFVNPLAALLSLAGNLFYVFVYTMWLKRSTVQNIVIGGAAGAVPPLVGWAAVTGSVNWAAFVLFLIIFLWTPPHFWALALYKNDDYKAANVPMYPVVHGKEATVVQMLLYSALLLPATLFLVAVHPMTLFYFIVALVLGTGFAWFAYRVARERTDRSAKQLFGYSIVYLALIFSAMVVDRMVMADRLHPMLLPASAEGVQADLSRNLAIHFDGEVEAGLTLTAVPTRADFKLHPNESRDLAYLVTNTGKEPVIFRAEPEFTPAEAGGFYKKIRCFCYEEKTLKPGESEKMPITFSFVDALPKGIEAIDVRYRFVKRDQ